MIRSLKEVVAETLSYANNLGEYFINDPSTPNLSVGMSMPPKGFLDFSVRDMSPSPANNMQKRATNCHMIIGNCINNMQKHLKVPVRSWANGRIMQVYPAAGREMNAYYDRNSLKFFYYPHGLKNVYFADSSDIVAHELGHAFLDAMRPDLWNLQALEIWSFHEAFSDIVAMFNLMSYDKAILHALGQTGGRIEKSNVISRLAEEVGVMIRQATGDPSYLSNALRDPAVEQFKYVNPASLPEETANNRLASECHSFGRVFSAAWYRIFVRFFEMNSKSSSPMDAFVAARDSAFSMLLQAIPASAASDRYYANVAKSMVAFARARSERHGKIVSSVFSEWNILQPENLKIQSYADKSRVVSSLKNEDKVLKTGKSLCIRLTDSKFLDLEELPLVSSMSFGKKFKVQIPWETYYEFDLSGNLVGEAIPDLESAKKSATLCLMSISDKIGAGKMWNIEGELLKRRYI